MNKTIRFLMFLALLALCFYLGRFIDLDAAQLDERLGRYPLALSSAVFVVLYVAVTFFVWFGAKDIFRIASALVYGPYLSALLVYLGEMGNALVLFHLSRRLGQDYVVHKLGIKEESINKNKQDKGFLGTFTLRINPLVPYRLQDLGAGLSTINFKKYMSAIAIASAPRILFFQYVIAGVGMSIFKDTEFAMQYMMEHQEILVFGQIYFLAVILFTLFYFFSSKRKRTPAA
jgi:uncharacterized membrane protein YdjX (TVP38/TMEM64 family)